MTTCPTCRGTVETVMARGQRGPQGGDVIVCLRCGAICTFWSDLTLHVLQPHEARFYNPTILLEAIAVSDSVRAKRQAN
jgi:hypothetical protein